jgi:hypothetical protein
MQGMQGMPQGMPPGADEEEVAPEGKTPPKPQPKKK